MREGRASGAKGLLGTARDIVPFVLKDAWLWGILIITSLAASLMEGVGMSMLLPLLKPEGTSPLLSDFPLIGDVLDLISLIEPGKRLTYIVAVLFGAVFLRSFFLFSSEALSRVLSHRVTRDILVGNFSLLLTAKASYIDSHRAGDLHNLFSGQAGRVAGAILAAALSLVHISLLGLYVAILLSISVTMTSLAFLVALLLTGVLGLSSIKMLRRVSRDITEKSDASIQSCINALRGHRLLLVRNATEAVRKSYTQAVNGLIGALMRRDVLSTSVNPVFTLFMAALVCFFLLRSSPEGTQSVQHSETVLFFFLALLRLIYPVMALNQNWIQFRGQLHAFDEVKRFRAELESQQESSGSLPFTSLLREVSFRDVTFRYDSGGAAALDGFSLSIPKGRMVALVGPSGAGKSTVVYLLARLGDPQEGSVELDGRDLKDFDLGAWRKRIAIVSQEPVFFNDTIYRNLTIGLDKADPAQVEDALELAQAADFVNALPKGIHTMMGERGLRLSGGQNQRLAIAQTLLSSPDILVLDEPTSHLDSITESAVRRAIDKLRGRVTIVIISHRLSTIPNVDAIYVMDKGKVVESGTREELLRNNGLFTDLLHVQRKGKAQ